MESCATRLGACACGRLCATGSYDVLQAPHGAAAAAPCKGVAARDSKTVPARPAAAVNSNLRHCWVQGYQIGGYQLDFSIALNLTVSAAANSSSNSTGNSAVGPGSQGEILTLTPAQPVALSSDRTLTAKLLGDLESYSQASESGNWPDYFKWRAFASGLLHAGH